MESEQKRTNKILVRAAIGITLLVVLIWNVNIKNLINSFCQISIPFLLFAICYQYGSVFVGSLNQYILFRTFNELTYKIFLISYFRAFAIGLLLPGRFGDAAIGVFLKSEGLYYTQAFSAYLWDKYLTFTLYLVIVLLFFANIMGQPYYIPLLLWLVLGLILPVIIYSVLRTTIAKQRSRSEGRWARFSDNLLSQLLDFAKLHPCLLLINLFITCIKLCLVILSYHVILISLGYYLGVWKVGLASLASGIVAYIPVSIQGLGTVEAAALFNFKTLGVSSSDVLVCYLLLRTNTYVLALFAYFFTFLLHKKPNKEVSFL